MFNTYYSFTFKKFKISYTNCLKIWKSQETFDFLLVQKYQKIFNILN